VDSDAYQKTIRFFISLFTTIMPTNTSNQKLIPRPPIVVVMGHIDHGKSTLLEYIRKTNITDAEAGGITQHVGAYEVSHEDDEGKERKITFIDTPGHEAFGAIRSRGANLADVAILVVSAEEGVKPQTIEALRYIKEESLPYIVAITKIDKPEANVEKVKQSLLENEIYLEGWGGEIPNVAISSKTGEGITELLEVITLLSDLNDQKEDSNAPAEGFIIESHLDKKKGIVATLIITKGTLTIKDIVVAGKTISPVRIMENHKGEGITEATFSTPVRIIGWSEIPAAGLPFKGYDNKKDAEAAISASASDDSSENEKDVHQIRSGANRVVIPLVIKVDVWGSAEALEHELKKIETEKVVFNIIHKGVGDINESDVKAASGSSDSVIAGFNVKIDSRAAAMIDRLKIETSTFDIIYKLTEWLSEMINQRTPTEKVETPKGTAKIMRIFSVVKDRQIIGGKVNDGSLSIGDTVKIVRRENEIGKGTVKELQQQKVKAKEVSSGNEFGAMVESRVVLAAGDHIIPFTITVK